MSRETSIAIVLDGITDSQHGSFKQSIARTGIKCDDKICITSPNEQLLIPDLNDKSVQEYLLKILFSEEFSQFCSELRLILAAVNRKVKAVA
jgi:hypothetical protein